METFESVTINENCLQPFFILHKASQPTRKNAGKAKRKIDSSPKGGPKSNDGTAEALDCIELSFQNFRLYWSKVEAIIKDVLRNINADEFDKIDAWIRQSFDAISSCTVSDPTQVTSSYPLLVPANERASSKQLFTGLVCTKNVEFVDDILTFEELGQHLRSCGYHVANLTSLYFSLKNGISGCLRNFLQHFLTVSIDAADISALASWYCEQGSSKNPIIVIIDDLERCCESVLSDFIIMLSEWAVKISIVVILGVTTTVDALRDILPSYILQYLCPSKFVLESPIRRMDAVIASVLVKHGACFSLGHDVATFLRNYFLRQDGTLTSFIRALKMASFQHFIMNSLSHANSRFIETKYLQDQSYGNIALLQEGIMKESFDLQPHLRNNQPGTDGNTGNGLREMQKQSNLWSSLVMCLYEAVKYNQGTLLDVYCETLDTQLHESGTSGKQVELRNNGSASSSALCLLGQHSCLQKCGSVCQAIRELRDLPPTELYQLLMKWEKLTEGFNEVHEKIKDVKASMNSVDIRALTMQPTDNSKRRTTRGNIIAEKDTVTLNEKAASLASFLVREYMQPVQCCPLHELISFNSVGNLQSALMGDPRRRIQFDLLESQKFLKCSCCRKSGDASVPSMHDTAIMYSLAQEHGDLINLHNWFQSFKASISLSGMRTKNRLKESPSSKKRKTSIEPQDISDASIQHTQSHIALPIMIYSAAVSGCNSASSVSMFLRALPQSAVNDPLARFCRAISELQIAGLLRMPSKRRPDFVQRVAFGV